VESGPRSYGREKSSGLYTLFLGELAAPPHLVDRATLGVRRSESRWLGCPLRPFCARFRGHDSAFPALPSPGKGFYVPGTTLSFLGQEADCPDGGSNTAPAVPSKEMSSISSAAGLFLSFVMIFRWCVWIVAVSSSSENVMTVSRSGRSGTCGSFREGWTAGIGSGD
jgi:hypothetical protein